MQFRIYLTILVFVAVFSVVSLAEEPAVSTETAVSDVNAESTPVSFPYVAEVTGDSVNTRSGPGTNFYSCDKLNTADLVKVVGRQFGWSRIVPPAGSFSWISKRYVTPHEDNQAVGTVTGENVRVYAGSVYREPIHSDSVQLRLSSGSKVNLLGEEKDDYYKIIPPGGAYLWISSGFVKASQADVELAIPPMPTTPTTPSTPNEAGSESPVEVNSIAASPLPVESLKLNDYYDLKKQLDAESAKPMDKQDYAALKEAFAALAGDKEAGKAARYSAFAIEQIKRFELARSVGKATQIGNEQLEAVRKRIEQARTARLAEIVDLGRFAVVGKFEKSKLYGPEKELIHYRITDEQGRISCYALPDGFAAKMDLDKFIDRKVGLVGTIEPHIQTKSALVQFSEIAGLD